MCKKLIVLVFCATVPFSGATMADVDDSGRLIVPEVSVAPIIDGELDDVWQKVGEESLLITEIINATSAVPEDLNDLSATFQVMHDADNFYVYVVIQDSVIDYQFSDWNGDGVELFFDGDNSKGSSYDGVNDNQIRITVDDVELANIDSSLPVDGSAFKVILTDLGYNIEASFPLETLQIVPENTFGFEVQLNDNDGGSGRETLIRWFSNDNNSWRDASLFGEAILVSEPEPVNPGTDGLVALYALDGDVNDSSGNGLDGTIVGDPVFVEGVEGMAMDFDGVDDLVELGKFDVVGQITLAAWIKADDFEINDARVISKANEWGGNDHWWMLSTISETSLRFRLKTDDGQDTTTLISDPVLEAGVWTHVAATWDGSMMRIYKDGQEVASQEKGGSAVAVDPAVSVAIGSQPSDAFASDPSRVVKFFDGLIDDARIYDRALSEGELLYLAGERATPVDPGTDGLVAFYALDGDPNDSSGNDNNGTIGGTENWVDGKIGSALEFDGSSTYVEIPFSESLRLLNQGDFTLSAWFKPDEIPPENKEVFQQGDGNGTGRTWLFVHSSNEIRSYLGGGTTASGIGVEADTWYHAAVVVTEGGDADNIQLYVNGQQAGEPTQRNMEDCEGVYFIGRHKNPTNFWDGLVDEIQLYNRGLSAGEIRYLAGAREVDPSLVIYYSFDEVSDIVADQSGKGHDGVVVGDVTAEADGMYNGAANFATGSYLDLDGPSFPAEDIPTSAMTLAAWIKCANTGGDHEIFSARASDNTWLIHPEPKSSGDIRWLLRSYGGTTIFQIRAGTMTWDEWLHFAGTYDKESGKAALYINGELIEEIVVENPADIAGDWGLGARVGLTIDDARPFTGLMDEFRMYTRALSQDEILEIMQGM